MHLKTRTAQTTKQMLDPSRTALHLEKLAPNPVIVFQNFLSKTFGLYLQLNDHEPQTPIASRRLQATNCKSSSVKLTCIGMLMASR